MTETARWRLFGEVAASRLLCLLCCCQHCNGHHSSSLPSGSPRRVLIHVSQPVPRSLEKAAAPKQKQQPWGSNPRAEDYGPSALPTELGGLCLFTPSAPCHLTVRSVGVQAGVDKRPHHIYGPCVQSTEGGVPTCLDIVPGMKTFVYVMYGVYARER